MSPRASKQICCQSAATGYSRPQLKASWLHYFIDVIKTGDIRVTAQNLNMTSQAIKRNLEQLENCLAIDLLHIQGSKIQLTTQGQAFYKESLPIYAALRNLSLPIQSIKKRQRSHLRIAYDHPFLQPYLVELCALVRSELNDIRFQVIQHSQSIPVEQMLIHDQVDLFLTLDTPNHFEISSLQSQLSPYLIVSKAQVSQDWKRLTYGFLNAEQASVLPWTKQLKPSQLIFAANQFQTLIHMAQQGFCAIYLPQRLIQKHLDDQSLVVVAQAPEHRALSAQLCWLTQHSDTQQEKLIERLLQSRRFHLP